MFTSRCIPFVTWAAGLLLLGGSPEAQARPPRAEAEKAAGTRTVQHTGPLAKKAWLGTALVPLGKVDRKQKGVPRYGGVLVERVLKESPAGRTGIQAGDVIMRLDDKYVYQPEEVIRQVQSTPIGKRIKIDVIRNGGWLTASVRLTPRPGSVPPVPPAARPAPPARPSAPAKTGRSTPHPPARAAAAPAPTEDRSSLAIRLAALEREVRLLRKAILNGPKRCRH